MGRRCMDEGDHEWLSSFQTGIDEVESVLLISRAIGLAFETPSELKPTPLPWNTLEVSTTEQHVEQAKAQQPLKSPKEDQPAAPPQLSAQEITKQAICEVMPE